MAEGNQTKAVIGQTFVELCETKELNKISIQELAEKAQINRQTFYYHFPDKKSIDSLDLQNRCADLSNI